MNDATAQRGGAKRAYDLQDRLIAFAARVLDVVEALPRTRTGAHLAGQLVRAGTSPVANYGEAQSAESRQDFIHKVKVALKELRETRIWLMLVQRKGLVRPPTKLDPLLVECDELIAILFTSTRTAARNRKASAAG